MQYTRMHCVDDLFYNEYVLCKLACLVERYISRYHYAIRLLSSSMFTGRNSVLFSVEINDELKYQDKYSHLSTKSLINNNLKYCKSINPL